MTASCKPNSSVCTPSTKIVSGKTTVASCTQASVKLASWTTNKAEQNGVTATAFNPAEASSVASGIEALLSQWNNIGDNSKGASGLASSFESNPKTAPTSPTTFATSKVSISTGTAIKRRELYL
ncbi:hypothetical protein OCU04_011996 [Sclerotinia nivalis]|uniref:Uncharacterized protein n=1 Tax=Sclerotinia nivalis TaxID=352851 RepID=A0A9X0AA53_9HELO|nr:hypothetical protein OCU04_011996 [Sclerotinia nivalis]